MQNYTYARGGNRQLERLFRLAILNPLVGVKQKPIKDFVEFGIRVDQVRKLMQAQLERLTRVKDPIVDPIWVPYCVNCPPACVKTVDGLRPCGRPFICPWCYFRRTVQPGYINMVAALRQLRRDGTTFTLLQPGYRMQMIEQERRFLPLVLGDYCRSLSDAVRTAREERQVVGIAIHNAVFPAAVSSAKTDKVKQAVVATSRRLAIRLGGYPEDGKVDPSDADFLAACGWLYRYPASLLRGDPTQTNLCLREKHGRKMSRTTGIFRGKRAAIDRDPGAI